MHDGPPMWFHTTTRGVVSCRILQSPGKSPHTSPSRRKHARYRTKNQWSSDSPMDLDDELPRIQHQLECIRNPVAVKQRRQESPVPVTERLVWTSASAEQAVNTPNDDEERLEQMSHPKNQGDGTDDAPRKVEWTCLGLYGMAMERSCSLWRRREFWDHSVPPNTTRSTRQVLSVWV